MTISGQEQVEAVAESGSLWSDSEVEARSKSVYLPGLLAGLVGFVVFLILHAVWIVPIWFIIPIGVVVAGLGGLTVDWAFAVVKPHLPSGVLRRWVAVAGGTVIILTPSTGLFLLGNPTVPVVDGVARVDAIDIPSLAVRFVVDLLVVSGVTGAVVGGLLTRDRRGVLAVSAAAVAFALGPGHNLPFFHLTALPDATQTGLLLMLAAIASASMVLVTVDRFFRGEA